MQYATHATNDFTAQHRMVPAAVACGLGTSALVTKRTRIWAGGLSTAGGTLPE
jgi:hypothetical protein